MYVCKQFIGNFGSSNLKRFPFFVYFFILRHVIRIIYCHAPPRNQCWGHLLAVSGRLEGAARCPVSGRGPRRVVAVGMGVGSAQPQRESGVVLESSETAVGERHQCVARTRRRETGRQRHGFPPPSIPSIPITHPLLFLDVFSTQFEAFSCWYGLSRMRK